MSAAATAHRPATIGANLRHDCACGRVLTLTGARPLPDFTWWLQQLAQHKACS